MGGGDVIRASAVVVASGDANTDWLSIGLLQSKDGTFETGGPYVTLTRRAVDPGADLGLLRIYGGLGNTNELATLNNLKEAQGFTTNLNARNTVSFEYDTASGNLQVWLTSEGGTTVTHYDGSVDYNGVVGQAVPLDSLVGRFEDGCLELEREITLGGNIGWQDQKWHVFRESGDSVNAGAGSLFDLIISLSPNATDEARSKTKGEL